MKAIRALRFKDCDGGTSSKRCRSGLRYSFRNVGSTALLMRTVINSFGTITCATSPYAAQVVFTVTTKRLHRTRSYEKSRGAHGVSVVKLGMLDLNKSQLCKQTLIPASNFRTYKKRF